MPSKVKKPTWEQRAAMFLKAELKRAEITYEELAERLKDHGYQETKASVANKLSRGSFTAAFFLATACAIGLEQISMEDV
jgi:hypothetical protein